MTDDVIAWCSVSTTCMLHACDTDVSTKKSRPDQQLRNHDVQLYLQNIRDINQPIWSSVAVALHQQFGKMWSCEASALGESQSRQAADATAEASSAVGLAPKLCSLVGIAGVAATVTCSVVICAVVTRRLAAMESRVLTTMRAEFGELKSAFEADIQDLGAELSSMMSGTSVRFGSGLTSCRS